MNLIKLAVIVLFFDAIYLLLTSKLTLAVISKVQNAPLKLRVLPAIICYVFIISLIYKFLIEKEAPLYEAFLLGAFVYGIYETTNMATLKDWSPQMVVLDTLWGGALFALSVWIYRKL